MPNDLEAALLDALGVIEHGPDCYLSNDDTTRMAVALVALATLLPGHPPRWWLQAKPLDGDRVRRVENIVRLLSEWPT